VVVGCLVHVANLPRWDILPLTYYPVDTEKLQPVWPRTEGRVRIGHAPNHRGAKGTEFVIAAVEALRRAGRDLELVLIEGLAHDDAMALLAECDIVVEQLVFGYALTAMEAMALGKVVITGIDLEAPSYRIFRRYSYLDELPALAANPEDLSTCMESLLERRREWPAIGRRCRDFVERRHSFAACSEMWAAIYARIWRDEPVDLMNYYHPLRSYLNGHTTST
jgi:glycosyltransferase involved in cell wall biosynthesis